MKEKNNHTWFLDASKEKAKEFEEEKIVNIIVNAISARNHRNLIDTLSELEQSRGWQSVIEYLINANEKTYTSNLVPNAKLEPLKYREVIFNLFHCKGLEPIEVDTITLLKEVQHEKSFIDAMKGFVKRVEELVWDQITKGDLLFFSIPYDNTWISDDLKNRILDYQIKEINNTIIWKKDDKFNIESLWYSELGRQALSSIGIQGVYISQDELSQVLTVIQVSPKPEIKILNIDEHKQKGYEFIPPSHKDYKILQKSIIEKNSNNLSYLGSKHSIPTFKCMLFDSLKNYEVDPSSRNYQDLLTKINYHIIIRELDSISILEQLSQLKDQRITTISIIALGNFFHESAALALINLACNKKNNEVIAKALTALENLCVNQPEIILLIEETLRADCTNYSKLKQLYKKVKKK